MGKNCKICGGKFFAKELCKKHYNEDPKVKAKTKEYMKNYHKKYFQKPEVRARQQERSRFFEVKAKKKAYYQRK